MKVVVFGSANLDKTYRVDSIVTEGETVSCTALEEACGGKGFNQAIALARAGADTFFAGALGFDGSALVDELLKTGVDARFLMCRDTPSGHAIIQLDSRVATVLSYAQPRMIPFPSPTSTRSLSRLEKETCWWCRARCPTRDMRLTWPTREACS